VYIEYCNKGLRIPGSASERTLIAEPGVEERAGETAACPSPFTRATLRPMAYSRRPAGSFRITSAASQAFWAFFLRHMTGPFLPSEQLLFSFLPDRTSGFSI